MKNIIRKILKEEVSEKQEKYLDNIVEHLVNRTKYDTDHHNVYIIKFPFSDTWDVFGSHGKTSDIYDISPKRFENYRWNFDQKMIEVFDLIEHEADYVWEKYFEGARFFGNEYAKSDGLINESTNKQKKYLEFFIKEKEKILQLKAQQEKSKEIEQIKEEFLQKTFIDKDKEKKLKELKKNR